MTVRIRHPHAFWEGKSPPSVVMTGAGGSEVDDTGAFDAPDVAFVRRMAGRHGLDARDLLVDDGECPFCDDYEGEHVGKHATKAHPDAWADLAGGGT